VLLVSLVALSALAAATPVRGAVAPVPPGHAGGHAQVAVSVDRRRDEMSVTIGPYYVPQAPEMMGDMMMSRRNHEALEGVFAWPVTGSFHAVKLEVVDSAGRALPRRLLHHTYMVNFDRRQLVDAISECPFSFGEETGDIAVPATIGMPMQAGMRIGIAIMWDNLTGHEVNNAYVRYTFRLNPRRQHPAPMAVLPFFVDSYNHFGGLDGFDVPPGGRTLTKDFTVATSGHLLAASGHLHDHAVMMRLEDVRTGHTLVTVRTRRDSTGHTLSVDRPIMGLWHSGPHLRAGHPYRLVVVYDNPTADTLFNAMGMMGGIYVPDRLRDWPAVDPQNADYRADMEGYAGVDSLLADLEARRPRVATR